MKIFHHNDLDGRCAACWVLCGTSSEEEYIDLIEMDYNKEFPIEDVHENEEVYIVDFSIEPEMMARLLEKTDKVVWIDHHKSAIEKYADFPYAIKGIRRNGVAGCMLTYCYFHHMTHYGNGEVIEFDELMTEEAPMFTKLIADQDVWTFEYENTREFVLGLSVYDTTPTSDLWLDLLKDEADDRELVDEIVENGRLLMIYRDNLAERICHVTGFEAYFTDNKFTYGCYAINASNINSDWFKSINQDEYDILVSYYWDGTRYNYFLYSTKLDVSEIAMQFGGGGHKDAAGFSSYNFLLQAV